MRHYPRRAFYFIRESHATITTLASPFPPNTPLAGTRKHSLSAENAELRCRAINPCYLSLLILVRHSACPGLEFP